MLCNPVAFIKTMGTTKTTYTIQAATNKGVECWICGNHGNHEFGENHKKPGCKPQVLPKKGLEIPNSSESTPQRVGVARPREPCPY